MSLLEKIQNLIIEELAGCADLTELSVNTLPIYGAQNNKKSLSEIIVYPPLPISVAKNANCVFFEEVLVKIKIITPKNLARFNATIFEISEILCKKLHNKKLGVNIAFGKILLSKNNPWEFEDSKTKLSMTINFYIQSVKL